MPAVEMSLDVIEVISINISLSLSLDTMEAICGDWGTAECYNINVPLDVTPEALILTQKLVSS